MTQKAMLRLLILAQLLSIHSVFAADIGPCDVAYRQRETLPIAKDAFRCFRKVQAESRSTDATTFRDATERALQTLIWIYTQSPEGSQEQYADEGLTVANEVFKDLPSTGLGPYWLAVFHVMKCRAIDTGMIPTCFMKRKSTIIDLLKKARTAEAAVHGYGPGRTLGILYREMPRIVGGDMALAKSFSEEAVKGAPKFSTNLIENAKTVLAAKNKSGARTQLETFFKTPCEDLDPTRLPECKVEKKEATSLLKKL